MRTLMKVVLTAIVAAFLVHYVPSYKDIKLYWTVLTMQYRTYPANPQPVTFSHALNVAESTAAPGLSDEARTERMLRATVLLHTKHFLGSGVIIDNQLCLVLTNAHVVNEGGTLGALVMAGRYADHFPDYEATTATVLGVPSNTGNGADLAIVQLGSCQGLPWAPIADAGSLKARQTVIAIGQPLGLLWTVSRGVISNPYQFWGTHPNFTAQGFMLVQTDAAINHGNSGGPLYTTAGYVAGINSLSEVEGQNLAFAHGPAQIQNFLAWEALRGRMPQFPLGATVDSIGVLSHVTDGAVALLGLQVGDSNITVNGVAVYGTNQFKRLLYITAVQGPLTVTFVRHRVTYTVHVDLAAHL